MSEVARGWPSPAVDPARGAPSPLVKPRRTPVAAAVAAAAGQAFEAATAVAWRDSVAAALGPVAALLPATVAVARATGGVAWRADMPLLRDQALVAVGLGGAPSSMLGQALSLLPLGSLPFRAAVGSALALALASWLVWRMGRRLLALVGCSGPLGSLLASVAALTVGLSASWQGEATVGGGAMMATALSLAALELTMQLCATSAVACTPDAARRWLWLSVLVGLTLAESIPCGIALSVAVVLAAAGAGRHPSRALWLPLLALLAAVTVVLDLPLLLRPLSPHSLSDVGQALSMASLAPLRVVAVHKAALLAWLDEVGVVSLLLAALGLVTGLRSEARRRWMSPLVALMVVDLCYPLSAASGLQADPLAALRALALSAFALSAALGLAVTLSFIASLDVPMKGAARILLVVFYLTAAAVASEESAWAADRSGVAAAESWTDAALASLPTGAAVLVSSPPLAWRLWSAQVVTGRRPDLLVIPLPLLQRGLPTAARRAYERPDVMARSSRRAPGSSGARRPAVEGGVAPLLRELALDGQASEYALSLLADARPLFVELDARWSRGVVRHLAVSGPWLRYAAQPLGSDERAVRTAHVLALDGRVTAQLRGAAQVDRPTMAVVVHTLEQHVTALALAGGGDSTSELLTTLDALAPAGAFVVGARLRLAQAKRTRRVRRGVDLRDLLRF